MPQPTIARITDAQFIPVEDVMVRLGYKDRQSFYESARRSGMPLIRLSRKRIVFEESSLNRWLASRVVGKVPVNPSVN